MRFGALMFLAFPAAIAHAQEGPPPRATASDVINVEEELERVGPMDGVWIAMVRPTVDTVGIFRQWPKGYPIRVEISGEDVKLWTIEKGAVFDPFQGDAALNVQVNGTALISYALASETFTELWSISLNQLEPDLMKGFISRTVHNVNVRNDSPWRVFAVYSIVDFARAPEDFLEKP